MRETKRDTRSVTSFLATLATHEPRGWRHAGEYVFECDSVHSFDFECSSSNFESDDGGGRRAGKPERRSPTRPTDSRGQTEWRLPLFLRRSSDSDDSCPLPLMGHAGHVASDESDHMMQQEPAAGRGSRGTTWRPLDSFQDGAHCEYAVIVLNRPVCWRPDVLLQFWQKARITVTVDGGTQRWLKYLEEQGIDALNDERYVPDLITGDMDSCPLSLIEKLGSMGSTVVETPDQNHTDYTKALLQVAHYARTRNINLGEIYVLAETSGRFDHIIGNVNTLYKSEKLVGNTRVIQVASNSLTWILKPGVHSIHIPEILVQKKSWCGLLPFGCSVNCISTTGLKWNLNNSTMQFGGLISTSNTYENSKVTVNTDTSVIWTMGIESLKDNVNDEAS